MVYILLYLNYVSYIVDWTGSKECLRLECFMSILVAILCLETVSIDNPDMTASDLDLLSPSLLFGIVLKCFFYG